MRATHQKKRDEMRLEGCGDRAEMGLKDFWEGSHEGYTSKEEGLDGARGLIERVPKEG